jgi:uncharacterized protein YbjT (DUF2867 family)
MLLVTGATGNVGRELVRALDAKGADIRILVRDPARATGLPERATRFVGDLGEPATLTAAFEGVDGVFLLTPGMGLEHAVNAVALAQAAGVRRIVHLSSFNVLGDPMPAMGRWHHEREEIIRASGIPATFLRPGGFMTNALEWAPTIRAGGYVVDATGPGRHALIDPADIADVAALALTEDGHEGEAYLLSGGEPLTVAEQVAVIAKEIGRDIEVREAATPEDVVRSRFAGGAPPALAEALIEGLELMRADTVGFRTDTVARLLGREPRPFAAWCARHADAFRPDPQA